MQVIVNNRLNSEKNECIINCLLTRNYVVNEFKSNNCDVYQALSLDEKDYGCLIGISNNQLSGFMCLHDYCCGQECSCLKILCAILSTGDTTQHQACIRNSLIQFVNEKPQSHIMLFYVSGTYLTLFSGDGGAVTSVEEFDGLR